MLDDPLMPDPDDDWGLDPLLAGGSWSPPIIIGSPSPSNGNTGNLDPDSPLNPFPSSGDSFNPLAPPELSSPLDQFPEPFYLPPTGGGIGSAHAAAPTPAPVPEPGTVILLGSGLIALFCYKRHFKKS